jgi:hypothetical protein
MPRKRELSSKQTAASAKRKAPMRKPKSSSELRKIAKETRARAEQLGRLYQPLHEAGQAELKKTASGRKLLEEARTLGSDTEELRKKIASGRTAYEEGQRRLLQRSKEFQARHQERYLEAYGRHAGLQPSVESIVQILEPKKASDRVWVSETAFLQAMNMRPKPAPEAIETVSQGLGDPPAPPQPVHSCLVPPYGHREDGYGYLAPLGDGASDAEVNGNLSTYAMAMATLGIPEATRTEAWVGGDFAVPAGINSFALTVDYDFDFVLIAGAFAGIAFASSGVQIDVDKGDGTRARFPETSDYLGSSAPWGNWTERKENAKVTVSFSRDGSSAGTVRVLVGLASDAFALAIGGAGEAVCTTFVREICLNSAV